MDIIFYGAGRYATQNTKKWIDEGWNPVCFADRDSTKWGKYVEGIEILPFDEARKRFPDYKVVITVDSHFKEVYKYIVSQGISGDKIEFIVPREYRKGCRFLGKFWQYGAGSIIRPCCYDHGYVIQSEEGNFYTHFQMFQTNNAKIMEGLKDRVPTSCDGCTELCEDWWEIKPKLNCVSFASGFRGDICNAKCVYCSAKNFIQDTRNAKISMLDAIRGLSDVITDEELSIIFNNGEFTVNADKYEIMQIWREKGWSGLVLTNAICFEPQIAEFMKQGKATLQCSLDAGTRKTFLTVKGVDCFERVCSNLRKYAESGVVQLKYIVCKGLNDKRYDIEEFIDFAAEIHAEVHISRDLYRKSILTDDEYQLFAYFVKESKKANLNIVMPFDVFHPQDVQRMRELL